MNVELKFISITYRVIKNRQTQIFYIYILAVTIAGTQVGIIGYIIKDRHVFDEDMIEDIIIKDEIESVRAEAKRLTALGVNIIIATGHAGYDLDQKMAKEIKKQIGNSIFTSFTQLLRAAVMLSNLTDSFFVSLALNCDCH